MQKEREVRDMRDPFDMFGGIGNFGSFSSVFGRNPFDDPFFTRPFSNMFMRLTPWSESPSPSGPSSKRPVIHELNSDDEREDEQENEGDKDAKVSRINKEPFVDHPDEEEEPDVGNSKHVAHRADFNKAEGTRARTFQFHSCKVTYGGVDGEYYTSSTTRRMGDDGVLMEECKEADKTTGEAQHRISRGINDKGHSLTRKLNSDGKVDTLQTLHNLNEDELETFENSWKGNAGRHLPSQSNSSSTRRGAGSSGIGMFDLVGLLPSSGRVWGAERGGEAADSSIRGQPKKVVRINIE